MADENPYKSPEAEAVAEVIVSTSDDRTSATQISSRSTFFYKRVFPAVTAIDYRQDRGRVVLLDN